MKKIVSIAIAVLMAFACCTTAFADVNTYNLGSSGRFCRLTISGNTAICISEYVSGDDNVAEVVMTQSLEKQGFLWIWSMTDGEWTKTSDGSSMALTNTVDGLAKGKYRVKTVFTVTDKNGKVETIPLYSTEERVS